ncbi:MAG: glycosyltransferase family 1 protein [Proteobacteria bacterium]|nr:glycosyltransferase family 1 protein [Pseudomonadota bacterium]
MRILLVTDAWTPQVNGVVVTLQNTVTCLRRLGHEVRVISPEGFRTVPLPSYPEIRLALLPGRAVARQIRDFAPQAVHIATEGPLGIAARNYCVRHGWRFTTAYHTCFPEYVQARTRLPLALTYALMRWMHGRAAATMVATPAIRALLESRGFRNIVPWSRGVDTAVFQPRPVERQFPGPVFMYVGRIAVEKNLPGFLDLDLPGTKVLVGDGPQRAELQRRYPQARFLGARHGVELADCYRQADVFVFPSRTDTFGLVLIEALACGVPVAALPVRGPIDVITDPRVGVLDEDLRCAALRALTLDRAAARRHAEQYSWERCTQQFLQNLIPVRPPATLAAAA